MNILQNNLVNRKKNNNIISKNIFGSTYPNVIFESEIKSVNIQDIYFTNFIDNKRHPLVNALKNIRRRIIAKEVDYDKEYEIKDIKRKSNEQEKVDSILRKTFNIDSINVSLLQRLKSIQNPEIQLFFQDDFQGNYKIMIIDIYHLLLPAPDKSHKEKYANPKKKYLEHENANYDIKNIFK